ncbi:MAG: hypothetical protein IJ276_03125 [Alphaproteobacteria bacterium]|nr:hypothetical protein [Alphaproteobacteria bacterium]
MKVVQIPNLESVTKNHPHLGTVSDGWYVNDCYRVLLAQTGKYTHLRVRRLDDMPITCFSDMQDIKNHFLGPEVAAIQVFPRVSDYVNNSNTYHMFAWDGMEIPNLKELYQYKI